MDNLSFNDRTDSTASLDVDSIFFGFICNAYSLFLTGVDNFEELELSVRKTFGNPFRKYLLLRGTRQEHDRFYRICESRTFIDRIDPQRPINRRGAFIIINSLVPT